jgi:hypothetical protein
VGDRAHEWVEYTGYAFHLRRRLTPEEQAAVGEVIDLRGLAEGQTRFEAAKSCLPSAAWQLAVLELKGTGDGTQRN